MTTDAPMNEEWRPVSGFEGKYWISDAGRVRNRHKILNPPPQQTGYIRFALKKGGKIIRELPLHWLVLETFVGPKPTGMQADHLNGVRADNRLCNLKWSSVLENNRRKFDHGTVWKGEMYANAKLTNDAVRWIRDHHNAKDRSLSAAGLAKRFGVSKSLIKQVVRNERWTHV